jgi:hypothetical protein
MLATPTGGSLPLSASDVAAAEAAKRLARCASTAKCACRESSAALASTFVEST